MTPYMKKFVYASLFYLGLAAVFGILDGTLNLGYFGSYAHTHFSLLGFMAMIVFGIGYFILPRFNGTELRFEAWVPVHFWLANISLIGMVLFRGLAVETGAGAHQVLFIVCASLQVVSIFMFIVNIWVSLTPRRVPAAVPASQESPTPAKPGRFDVPPDKPSIVVNADTKVADLVDALPALKETLIESGLRPLAMPGHIDHIRARGVKLGTAAMNHGIDLDGLIFRLEKQLQHNGFAVEKVSTVSAPPGTAALSASTLIGEVIKDYPAARAVFQRHFGSGCFDCPGQAYESIDMACRMHGVDPEVFLEELSRELS
ncbi:MAG: DUF1858 domain-containing protein [Candidatus Zixiibacteriota bacterium]|nr:MAG: DUF1858 domain-containing protein [candidate division Zixibacteria bacterium]